jgi:squalene cyclase
VFEFNNKWNPDVDDTAMVLLALRKIPTANPRRRDECFQRGLNWMMTFQCKDGGWASFDKDCTKNILEKVPFADHNAMLDPECADITARILELLGYENFDPRPSPGAEALAFIQSHQEADGSWYGRWGVNYIYGTWQVLRGMRALGLDMREPGCSRRATGWKASSTKTAAGANAATPTTIPCSKARAQHRLADRLGRHGPSAPSTTPKTAPASRRGMDYLDAHPESRRLLDRTWKPPAPVSRRCSI